MADHIQRKTDEDTANIPLWYGEPAKDSFTLADYTAKLDSAQNLLELDEETTFRYFERSLRGHYHGYTPGYSKTGLHHVNGPGSNQTSEKILETAQVQRPLHKTSLSQIWTLLTVISLSIIHT